MQTFRQRLTAAAAVIPIVPAPALAQVTETARDTGVSAIWILANISFAGMRAQAHPSIFWRVVSFLFGFPGTLVSFLFIREGGGLAYGVELPSSRDGTEPTPLRLEVRDT